MSYTLHFFVVLQLLCDVFGASRKAETSSRRHCFPLLLVSRIGERRFAFVPIQGCGDTRENSAGMPRKLDDSLRERSATNVGATGESSFCLDRFLHYRANKSKARIGSPWRGCRCCWRSRSRARAMSRNEAMKLFTESRPSARWHARESRASASPRSGRCRRVG